VCSATQAGGSPSQVNSIAGLWSWFNQHRQLTTQDGRPVFGERARDDGGPLGLWVRLQSSASATSHSQDRHTHLPPRPSTRDPHPQPVPIYFIVVPRPAHPQTFISSLPSPSPLNLPILQSSPTASINLTAAIPLTTPAQPHILHTAPLPDNVSLSFSFSDTALNPCPPLTWRYFQAKAVHCLTAASR